MVFSSKAEVEGSGPERTRADVQNGHFFLHMSHFRYYEFSPSVRSFLAGLIECYSNETMWFDEEEDATSENFEATAKIWTKYAAAKE